MLAYVVPLGITISLISALAIRSFFIRRASGRSWPKSGALLALSTVGLVLLTGVLALIGGWISS